MTANYTPDFTRTGDVFVSRDGTEWRFRNDAKCVTQPITLSRIKNTSDSSSFWTSGRYVTDRTEHDLDIVSQYTQIYDAALQLAKRAEKLARKARNWEFIDTAEDVGGFGATIDGAARDYLWHRCPNR